MVRMGLTGDHERRDSAIADRDTQGSCLSALGIAGPCGHDRLARSTEDWL
jgi:hypothetical protein